MGFFPVAPAAAEGPFGGAAPAVAWEEEEEEEVEEVEGLMKAGC